MTYQQALFVKGLIRENKPLNTIAQTFVKTFGDTQDLPSRDSDIYSSIEGNDLKQFAQTILKERF